MGRSAQITRDSLATLGMDKLAALVLDEAGRNAPFKKRIAAALAGAKGPDAVAAIVDRRLASLERARGFIVWDKTKELAADLKATAATIVAELGTSAPEMALDRLLRFLACAEAVQNRAENPVPLDTVFTDAEREVVPLVARLPRERKTGALQRLITLSLDHALDEEIVEAAARSVSAAALERIEADLMARLKGMPPPPEQVGSDWRAEAIRARTIGILQMLAERRGDIDAIVALETRLPEGRRDVLTLAERLLGAGRPAQALEWVRKWTSPRVKYLRREDLADFQAGLHVGDLRVARLEVRILKAAGDLDAAQALRWTTFERDLDTQMLRDYVADLPDFEEFDALDKAFALARSHSRQYLALAFLTEWPRLDLAAGMVVEQRQSWKGSNYHALRPVAEALEDKHPLAATILYRALVDDIVRNGKSQAYAHAAAYLATLDGLDPGDLSALKLPSPADYRAELRKAHGRKYGFWNLVDDKGRPEVGRGRLLACAPPKASIGRALSLASVGAGAIRGEEKPCRPTPPTSPGP